jgi:acyl-CoA thioesterase I
MFTIEKLFVIVLALVGPPPADTPKTCQLKQGDTIVAIGDSITAAGGYLRDIDAVLAQQYPKLKLAKVVNKGIPGHRVEDLAPRFDKDVVQLKPTIVTLNIGVNDVWSRLSKPLDAKDVAFYKETVAKMVDQAQKAGIRVILLTPTVVGEDPNTESNKRLVAYVKAMKEIAADKKCQLVDLHAMFLTALKKKPADKKTWLTVDGVHMLPPGDAIMAIGVLRALGVPDNKIAASHLPQAK